MSQAARPSPAPLAVYHYRTVRVARLRRPGTVDRPDLRVAATTDRPQGSISPR